MKMLIKLLYVQTFTMTKPHRHNEASVFWHSKNVFTNSEWEIDRLQPILATTKPGGILNISEIV